MTGDTDDRLREALATIDALRTARHEPIAVVGLAFKLPGGNETIDDMTDFLMAGRSGIVPIPADRMDLAEFTSGDPGAHGRITAAGGGFLDDIDQFDAGFFGISPKEADYVDPQQRLLLETAWHALEHANIDPNALRHGNGGVYIGASSIDYALELDSLAYPELDSALATGITIYPLSGRLSYVLGWRGPSLSTDTACASSLTALHLAVNGLRRGECDIALCGAVNLIHHPRTLVMFSHGGMLSPDGHCKSFDDAADGYARAEGCGVLVLKSLSAALRDGDTVHAVVRGTAIGQDGASAGLTAPNGAAQEAVIRAALADAALTPADIQYVEAHGTGTSLGDPIEMGSINGVFGGSHTADEPLTVGSLKSNIGHMEPAAGLGGIVKTILQMRTGTFFPHLYETPSARIPWDHYPVRIPTSPQPWTAPVRRAIVNGFGFAGAIGVAVLEEPPAVPAAVSDDVPPRPHVFTLSAKTRPGLGRQVDAYRRFLAAAPDVDLGDLCRTGQVGRAHFGHRIADAVHSRDDILAMLDREHDRLGGNGRGGADFRKVAFLFSGSGSQYIGMGRPLYEQFPLYRELVDECDRLFAPYLGRSITALMSGAVDDPEALLEARYMQPALFTVEYALAHLWTSFGLRPNVLIGHSAGEVVAATFAGLFTLPDGVRFAAARSRLMHESGVGVMAAVGATPEQVTDLIAEHPEVSLAAINAPDQCVIAGAQPAVARAAAVALDAGWRVTMLDIPFAAHSPLMDAAAGELATVMAGIAFQEPAISLVSNVTGRIAKPETLATTDYWVRHLREPVNFAAGIGAIADRGRFVFVEVGPSTALTSLAARSVPAADHRWLSSLHQDDHDGTTIRRAVAAAYAAGLTIAWPAVAAGTQHRTIDLPLYAFDRKRYWLPNAATRHGTAQTAGSAHPLLGPVIGSEPGRFEFVARLSATHPGYIADHTLRGTPFLAATVYLEMLLEAQDAVFGETRRPIRDLQFHQAHFFSGDGAVGITTRIVVQADGSATAEITTDVHGERSVLVTAVIGGPAERTDRMTPPAEMLATCADRIDEAEHIWDTDQIYAAYARVGLDYGPQLRRVRTLRRYDPNLAIGELTGAPAGTAEYLPPPLSDAATHALAAFAADGRSYVAVAYAAFRFYRKPKGTMLRTVMQRVPESADLCVDIVLLDGDEPVFELSGMRFVQLAEAPAAGGGAAPPHHAVEFDSTLVATLPRAERVAALDTLIRTTVAGLLRIDDPDSIDSQTPFLQLGLNSLGAVELKTALETVVRIVLPPAVALDHPSTELLADFLDRRAQPQRAETS